MVIRPIQPADFTHFDIPPFSSTTSAWVLVDPDPIGYVAIDPVPGLSHILDLYGHVDPAKRRFGYGSQLMRFAIAEAKKRPGARQLSVPVDSTMGYTLPFLQQNDFYDEHLEYELVCPIGAGIRPNGYTLKQFPLLQAARKLNRLYDQAFKDLAWYQPYVDEHEIVANLGSRGQIYFLARADQQIVGFAGVNYEEGAAEIEPLGILPPYRGEGFGRILITCLLHTFAERRCKFAHLTVWADNTPALRLYESVGFVRQDTRQFMALDL